MTDFGRLCSHFDASLKYGDGKPRMRGTAQPQSEVRVRCLHLMLMYGELEEMERGKEGGRKGGREEGRERERKREKKRERER